MEEKVKSGQSRNCGGCTGCCVHLPISAGIVSDRAKPAGQACPHLGCVGCNIYENRPATCREFQCAWISRVGWPESWRPRESGLLCLVETVQGIGRTALVYENVALALQTTIAMNIVNRLLRETRAVVVVDVVGGRRTLVSHDRPAKESKPASPHFSLRPFIVSPQSETQHHSAAASFRNTV